MIFLNFCLVHWELFLTYFKTFYIITILKWKKFNIRKFQNKNNHLIKKKKIFHNFTKYENGTSISLKNNFFNLENNKLNNDVPNSSELKIFFENDLKVLLEKFEKYIKINYFYIMNIKKNTKIYLKNFKQKIQFYLNN
jgi:hypothetical protein